jgi:hypothetical protein
LQTLQAIAQHAAHADAVVALSYDSVSRRAVSGGKDGYARLWDIEVR